MVRQIQTRRDFLKAVSWGAAALAVQGCAETSRRFAGRSSDYPNIIFIMADDMGYGDVTCYNPDSLTPTPNMDRIAADGIRFTDAHSPSSLCSPTRYGVLTGRYGWRTRLKRGALVGFNPPLIEPGRTTVAKFLKWHGYETACIGKWHVGFNWQVKPGEKVDFWKPLDWPVDYITEVSKKIDYSKPITEGPTTHGFDYFFGTAGCPTCDPPYCFIENDRTVGIPSVMPGEDVPGDPGLMVPGWKHQDVDTVFVDKAVEFIKQHKSKRPSEPFFLYLPLSAPHEPHLPPDFIKGKSSEGPRGDMVAWVDWSVGQILDTLDKMNLTDNTLLIVTSDNGPLQGEKGHKSAGDFRGFKASIWEGGHRVPFIARWPGKIKPASTSNEVICLTDLMATCGAIVQTPIPPDAGEDSYNILPALLGEKLDKPLRQATVHHSGGGVFAVRRGKFKVIFETPGSGIERPQPLSEGQLYDMEKDPYEKRNLWGRHTDVIQSLSDLLLEYIRLGRSRPL
ncbi:MAG TPA: arylsulfatase [Planctomycetes bacterium]|nr:arylsulfatase [Planctomycetota bacterium]HIJ71263.1 arylsulfatase [Planctomycetota bacterium]